ncbi:MAG: hypothetical protein KHY83_08135 [Coriobacteriia bacterium]|nr:hypothetical protein [Coriobacteriia bacterium]MBS5478617.1 hypothetical protein [Coriobacteriia bacterium]
MALERDTVQHTLCIPLWGRAISAQRQPDFFPDPDAARILSELGEPRLASLFYRLEYPGLQCIVRQYDMACEIEGYVREHPGACVIELGFGLSCLRRQMTAGHALLLFARGPGARGPSGSPHIVGASECDYLSVYATPGVTYRAGWLTRRIMTHMRRRHLGFIVHVDFAEPGAGGAR